MRNDLKKQGSKIRSKFRSKFRLVAAVALIAAAIGTAYMLGIGFGGVHEHDDGVFVIMPDSAVPLAQSPAVRSSNVLTPVASGIRVDRSNSAEIDFSNAGNGYFMVRWTGRNQGDVRVVVVGPDNVQLQYRLNTRGDWEVFPLSSGNGNYIIRVMENVAGTRFAVKNQLRLDLTLTSEFAPFLRPNQFVNFNAESTAVLLTNELVEDSDSVLESVGLIFDWVINNIEYDEELARTVQSGYVPDLERLMERRRGICFDYASLMTAMLRSQGIPTRLVIGYVGTYYHAWISVFTEEYGWVSNLIMFDGNTWRIMDPTFAAAANTPEQAEYIARTVVGTGANHRAVRYH